MNEFEKRVIFGPAGDKRHSDPSKNYGIWDVRVSFLYIGPKGAIQFVVGSGWYLPHVTEELRNKNSHMKPMPIDLGYHSYEPKHEGQERMEQCDVLVNLPEGKGCYYDGSSLAADDVFEKLLREGSDAVWKILEERYDELFGAEEDKS